MKAYILFLAALALPVFVSDFPSPSHSFFGASMQIEVV